MWSFRSTCFFKKKIKHHYTGLDTTIDAIKFSKNKFPKNDYFFGDILNSKFLKLNLKYEVIVLNGIFTIKKKLSNKSMLKYIVLVLKKLRKNSKNIIILNLLTNSPDWKNKYNYYVDTDKFSIKIKKNFNCNYSIYYEKKLHEFFYVLKI